MKARPSRITKVFLAVAILWVASIAITFWVGQIALRSRHTVDTQRIILQSLERVITTVADAETDQRGYLLTGDENRLEPYQQALIQLRSHQENLRRLAESHELPSESIANLNRLIGDKIERMDTTIRRRRDEGLEAAAANVRTGKGKAIMDKIRAEVAGLSAGEQIEIDQSIRRAKIANATRTLTFLVTGLINLVFLRWAYRQITLEMRRREAAQEEMVSVAQFPEENPHPVLRLGSDAQVLYTNRAAAQLLMEQGWEPGRIVSGQFWEKVQSAFQSGQPSEFDFCCPQGRVFSFFCASIPDKRYVNLYGRDVTESKRAEEALRASEARYRDMFNTVIEGFCIIEVIFDNENRPVDYRFLEINPVFEKQTGLHDAKGKLMRELAPGLEEHWFEIYGKIASTGEPARFVNEAKALNRWYDVHAVRIGGEESRKVAISFNDITERKQAEEALRQSELFYRQTLESIPGMVFTTRPDGYCDFQSQQWIEFTGIPMSEHLGDGWNQLLHPDDRPRAYAAWRAAVDERADYDLEYRVRRHDGIYRWFKVRGRPIRNAEGRIVRWFGVALDIEALKQAEETLQRAKESLLRINEDLERKVQERTAKLEETVGELEHFSYTITHDMRAPLRAMHGLGQLLLGECAGCPHPQRKEFLQRISESAARMDSLITDALNYTKIVRKDFPLEQVNTAKLLRSMVKSYPEFQPPKAEVRIGDVPEVLGNEAGLTQCFSNILTNAVKFVQPGKVPKVRIWAENRGEYVRLWFEDNGIGIAKRHQEQIFVMFQRLSRSYEGTGIGLALVSKAVERMQGKVGVESEEGNGSRFWIELKSCTEI